MNEQEKEEFKIWQSQQKKPDKKKSDKKNLPYTERLAQGMVDGLNRLAEFKAWKKQQDKDK